MKKIYCLLVLLWPMFLYAQNFNNGYILTSNNDTLRGFINYQADIRMFHKAEFKPAKNAETTNYTPENISGYAVFVDGKFEHYQSSEVKISLSRNNKEKLSIGLDKSSKTQRVFLKVLTEGNHVNFYQYEDPIKIRYYIKEKIDDHPIELIQNIYRSSTDPRQKIQENIFISQLNTIYLKYNKTALKPIDYNYSGPELLRLIHKINNGTNATLSKHEKPVFTYVGLGATLGKASYSGTHYLARKEAVSYHTLFPSINFGLIASKNTMSSAFFKAELSLMGGGFHVYNSATASHKFNQYAIGLSPQFYYNFYNTSTLKIFAGGGFGISYAHYTRNEPAILTPNNSINSFYSLIFKKFSFYIPINAGVRLNQKLEMTAGYIPNSSVVDYHAFDLSVQRFRCGVNYFFN